MHLLGFSVLCLIWGTTWSVIAVGLRGIPPFSGVAIRFTLAGLILLVAMIGAIVLTLRHRTDIKRQNIVAQMMRDPATAMELKDVKPGQGL